MAAADLLRTSRTVLVIDWPSREVPDSLARAGRDVHVHGGPGPEDYSVYRCEGDDIVVEPTRRPPERADLVYSHRPLAELPGIVETARGLGAAAVWVQSGLAAGGGRDPRGCWLPAEDSRRARAVVEAAGLAYVDDRYLPDELG